MTTTLARRNGALCVLALMLLMPQGQMLANPLGVSGLVSYWRADGHATDSADSNPGTLEGGATYVLGRYGKAFGFDGSGDYVEIGMPANLQMTNEFTLATWLYPTGSPSEAIIINKENEYEVARTSTGEIKWAIRNTSPGWTWRSTGVIAPTNQWTHIAITYDGSAIRTYENGTLAHTLAGSGALTPVANSALRLGARGGTGPATYFFPGRLDEVAICDRALSDNDVRQLLAPGAVSHWRADGDAHDWAGANDGTLNGDATFATGKYGQAFAFDGSGDYVNCGDHISLEMTNEMTVGAWIYPTGPGSSGGIIVNREGEYEIARNSNGTIAWAFKNTNPGWAWINTGFVAPLNTWTHVAVVYDQGVIDTYGNGVLQHTYNGAGSLGDSGVWDEFWIGGRHDVNQFFDGLIDEVRVFNRALGPGEIPSLLTVPEPASLSLLGLGALALARRRRTLGN